MKKLFGALAAILLSTSTLHAQSMVESFNPMKFELMPTGTVRVVGVIKDDTYTKLRDFDKIHGLKGRVVVLDSQGGMTEVAMKIGRFFRKNQVTTTVGVVDSNGFITDRGECASACPLLFLGGVNRYMAPGNTLSVHQIWIADTENDEDRMYTMNEMFAVQASLGEMAAYIAEMGGSLRLLKIATSVPSTKLRVLTPSELKSTRLVTNSSH